MCDACTPSYAALGAPPQGTTMTAMPIALPPSRPERIALLMLVIGALLVSAVAPKDRMTWLLETVWVIVAIPVIALVLANRVLPSPYLEIGRLWSLVAIVWFLFFAVNGTLLGEFRRPSWLKGV